MVSDGDNNHLNDNDNDNGNTLSGLPVHVFCCNSRYHHRSPIVVSSRTSLALDPTATTIRPIVVTYRPSTPLTRRPHAFDDLPVHPPLTRKRINLNFDLGYLYLNLTLFVVGSIG